jgi:hypothetical protein
MEANNTEEEKPRSVKLETEVKNSIRHTYEALQDSNGRNSLAAGEVAKSKLQVLCATISRDIGIPYSADDLNLNFKEEKKSLSCAEFVEYLEEVLLPKGERQLEESNLLVETGASAICKINKLSRRFLDLILASLLFYLTFIFKNNTIAYRPSFNIYSE